MSQATEAPPPRTSSGDREPPAFDFDFSTPAGDDEVVEAVEEGAPAWMMTFGDMMSLLLTFFILLFSMSSIEVEKFRAATESLAEALGESNAGIMPDGAVPITPPPAPVGEVRDQLVQERIDEVATQLEEFVRENNLEEQVVVSKESHGVFLRMQNQALFGQGSADIAAESVAIVEQLGAVLDRMDLPVKVSGHTDNVPIRSSVFPSNWELSAARAAGVARILVSRGHDPATVAVEAFGEYRPVASNDTPEGRAENRRVELYFSRLSMEQAMDEGGELPQEADGEGSAGGAPEAEAPPDPADDEA
ncbi:MAG: flagellar motor protein MotB [Gemmatimonadetes bacterium]|nr:flagellar motor protein MotB [Gemmatimonadota bacterium]